MKIWYQSDAPLGFDPLWENYKISLEKNIDKIKLPDTLVEIYGNEPIGLKAANLEKEKLRIDQVINNAIEAQKNNYDVFVVGCTADPGRSKIRKLLNIPTIFIGENSMNFACALGKNISIVARAEEVCTKFKKNIRDYGLNNMIFKISHLSFTLEQLATSFEDPKPVIEKFLTEANKLVRKGAEVIIPGCGILNMLLSKCRIKRVNGVLVLDTAAILIKTAELLGSLAKK
jgi:Asp/Glu/hydantoin racemase